MVGSRLSGAAQEPFSAKLAGTAWQKVTDSAPAGAALDAVGFAPGGTVWAAGVAGAGTLIVRWTGKAGPGSAVLPRAAQSTGSGASGAAVVIKYLRRRLPADPEFTAAFRAEAAVLASLDDPNVTRLVRVRRIADRCRDRDGTRRRVPLCDILVRQGKTTAEAALIVLQGSLPGASRRAPAERGTPPRPATSAPPPPFSTNA
jgi:hypothetical protein